MNLHRTLRAAALAALSLSIADAWAIPEAATVTAQEALARLLQNSNGTLQQSAHASTAYFRLRAGRGELLAADDASAAPLDRALRFLWLHGAALGVTDPAGQFALHRVSRDAAGKHHVHLEQLHSGLPVFGARTVVHLDDRGVYGVSGVFVPDFGALSSTPSTSIATLRQSALKAAARLHPGVALSIESSRLMYYRAGLLDGHPGKNYLAYEAIVAGAPGSMARERIILNANGGGLISRIDEIRTVKHRQIYTPQYRQTLVLEEGGAAAPADVPLQGDVPSDPASRAPRAPTHNLYLFAGGTYDLYRNFFGQAGYDDGFKAPEVQVQESVYLVNERCPNAYWDGTSTNYCPGFDADDIVSHEWSHAYTEYTHGLIYQYQSGALNESYSDIFGETYDLVNGIEGPLGATLTEGDYYENGGSRWVVGEDLSDAAAQILLRDMWDPDAFPSPSPGKVTSENYYCGPSQSTLVHTDSGVPNHAFAMLVDGKSFNGHDIPKIGLVKAAHIYYQAQTHYQTPTTNFPQHAAALEQSCIDLVGAPLNDHTGAVSGEVITPQDCDAVVTAMSAVEMYNDAHEMCGYQPLLLPEADTPALCEAGQAEQADFSETFEEEGFPDGWTVSDNFTGDAASHSTWTISSTPPAPHTGFAAFIRNLGGGGSPGTGNDISGSSRLDTPQIVVAADQSFLRLTHNIASESGYDGGNVKVSVNGADFVMVPGSAMIHNPYNAELDPAADPPVDPPVPVPDPTGTLGGGNTNPMAGEEAWSGSDEGEASGSWGTTIVDLAAIGAKAGDKLRFRFEFGNDFASGNIGWYVDEVTVAHCQAGSRSLPVVSAPADASRFGGGLGIGLLAPLVLVVRRRRG